MKCRSNCPLPAKLVSEAHGGFSGYNLDQIDADIQAARQEWDDRGVADGERGFPGKLTSYSSGRGPLFSVWRGSPWSAAGCVRIVS